jgi:hypothetical protein
MDQIFIKMIVRYNMEDLVKEYIDEIENSDDFKRLLELKDIINKEYAPLIISFKMKEAEYMEAKERPEIFDLNQKQKEFSIAKANLYSKEYVKEYFMLEEKINKNINKDLDELKDLISNKFLKSPFLL